MSRSRQPARGASSNSAEQNTNHRVVSLNSSTPPKSDPITLLLCTKPYERQSYECVLFSDHDKLKTLKDAFLKFQKNIRSIDEFDLVYLDEQADKWMNIEHPHLAITLAELKIPSQTIISIKPRGDRRVRDERSIKTEPQARKNVEFNLKLCLRPRNREKTTTIKTNSTTTIGQLRVQLCGRFHHPSKGNTLDVWRNGWIQFDASSDHERLNDHHEFYDSYVSVELGVDFEDVVVPPGLVGLRNLGNTCFMNSIIQCFSHTPEFTGKVLALSTDIDSPILGEYTRLMRKIWSGCYEKIDIYILFDSIKESLPRYGKYRQQDAQEFMNHLLHAMHDELTEEKTLISELFYGRTQSRVTCNKCQGTENNHDRISFLPVPLKYDSKLKTFLLIRSNGELSVHSFVLQSSGVKFKEVIPSFLRDSSLKLKPEQIEVIELVKNTIVKRHLQKIYMDETNEENLVFREIPAKTSDEQCIECDFVDRSTQRSFRPPVLIACPSKYCLYDDIQQQIDQLRAHICSLTGASENDLHVSWTDKRGDSSPLKSNERHDTPLKQLISVRIQMNPEWVKIYQQRYDIRGEIEDDSLVGLLKDFFTEVPLSGDYWCSKCKTLTEAKQMSHLCLPLPPVLVIQLKRFTYDADVTEKIDAFIRFPLEGLDLRHFLVDGSPAESSTKYDLVAVSNHMGTLYSGHYTTYAKYLADEEWYLFDDNYVDKVACPNDVITRNAYVLIYALRKDR